MTKKSDKNEDDSNTFKEDISTPALLMKGYVLTQEKVDQYKKMADDTGLQITRIDMYSKTKNRYQPSELLFNYRSHDRDKTQRFIDQVCNSKTHKFWTLDSLIKHDIISEEERSLYDHYFPEGMGYNDFPVRTINQYHRVKAQGKEWLWTNEEWRGITNSTKSRGAVVMRTAALYTYVIPSHQERIVDSEGNFVGTQQFEENVKINSEGTTTPITTVAIMPNNEISGRQGYFLPWSKEVFESLYRLKRGELYNPLDGHSISLNKEGQTMSIGIDNSLDFAEMEFTELWKKYSAPRGPYDSGSDKNTGVGTGTGEHYR